jgi:hypothetical protein
VHEPAQHRADVAVVHRHPLAPVVERRAETAQLAHDHAAVLLEPCPGALDELLASEVVARQPFPGQVLLDDVLRRDAGVVVPGLPDRVEAAHPMPADEEILDRRVERVTHVEVPRHVRRRDADHERLSVRVGLGGVQAFRLPGLLPTRLDALRLVERIHRAIVASASEAAQRADEVTQRLCVGV